MPLYLKGRQSPCMQCNAVTMLGLCSAVCHRSWKRHRGHSCQIFIFQEVQLKGEEEKNRIHVVSCKHFMNLFPIMMGFFQ